jgi:hypothetical protein
MVVVTEPNLSSSRGSYTEGKLARPQFISADPKPIRDAFDQKDFFVKSAAP